MGFRWRQWCSAFPGDRGGWQLLGRAGAAEEGLRADFEEMVARCAEDRVRERHGPHQAGLHDFQLSGDHNDLPLSLSGFGPPVQD
jgi:hypothetical protein